MLICSCQCEQKFYLFPFYPSKVFQWKKKTTIINLSVLHKIEHCSMLQATYFGKMMVLEQEGRDWGAVKGREVLWIYWGQKSKFLFCSFLFLFTSFVWFLLICVYARWCLCFFFFGYFKYFSIDLFKERKQRKMLCLFIPTHRRHKLCVQRDLN